MLIPSSPLFTPDISFHSLQPPAFFMFYANSYFNTVFNIRKYFSFENARIRSGSLGTWFKCLLCLIDKPEAKVKAPNPKKGEWNLASWLSLKSYEAPTTLT